MFVRFPFYTVLIIFLLSNSIKAQEYDPIMADIKAINDQMEMWFEQGNLQRIGEMYLSDASIITPERTIRGREKIMKYWEGINNPVKWNLEVIEVSKSEKELYMNEYYEALDNKPPGWRIRGIEIEDDIPLVFQLGHSDLTTRNEQGDLQTSSVDFILIWKVLPEGTYRILLDTYTWQ